MTDSSNIAAVPENQPQFLGHPVGLYVCFLTEMWERFSFYGMKYLLLLYLTKYHLFSDAGGLDVLGSYAGLVYAMPVIGGMLADRYLGMRKAVTFGAILLCLGHLGLAYEGFQAYMVDGEVIRDNGAIQVFYFSLALIIMGVGFLKPNISTIVGQLYGKEDARRDSGFTIFYMGINLGSFIATLSVTYLGETYGWGYGFGLAGIGMVLGLIIFLSGQKYLFGYAEPSNPALLKQKVFAGINREWLIYFATIPALALMWQLVQYNPVVHNTLVGLSFIVLFGIIWFMVTQCTKEERDRMTVLIVLTVSTVVFWALFEQSASSMTLYADRVLDRSIWGFEATAGQFGALNAFFIILFAPLFAWLWIALARRKIEPSTPVKFALGIIQAGLGFGALVYGANHPNEAGLVGAWWLVLAYALHTMGELCLSPVGLSAVTKLAVPKVVGVMMGAWFLATAYSEVLATQLAKLAAIDTQAGQVADIPTALASYNELFSFLFYVGIGFGVFMLLLSPWLRKRMHGVH
ncbi:peptide MFS transporter [Rheinheimera salexigens]|uniref:MFS transporter n=1 Tax=Rheinheimera salexigens TaxID=1628148 RepID=A0A1E7Q4X9_9GAMM|nr:oligopeptide:H+ symporter [Rheinheimera salexigens]OEY69196.1 MFS transporter [Rheinheimera salexigens]